MSAYLAEHIPHLQFLHAQLALGPEALASDEARIEAAIRGAVSGLLKEREAQVDAWRDANAAEQRKASCLARALGERGKDIDRRESYERLSLPEQHQRLVKENEEWEKKYQTRLQHIEEQQAILNSLAILLGAPFEPAKPLEAVASSPVCMPPPPETAAPRRISALRSRNSGANDKKRDSSGSSTDKPEATEITWLDVGEAVVKAVDAAVQAGLEERVSRLQEVQTCFLDLRNLHAELSLPPFPTSHPHHFPTHLLPSLNSEETPGAHATYERLLAKVIAERPVVPDGQEDDDTEITALTGVEPEVGLMRWLEEIMGLWDKEREAREAKIQALFNALEPLWLRLETDQDQIDLFVQMNMGCGDASIRAYEAELERCMELRRSSLSSFMVGVRADIEMLWAELMMSDDERAEFGAFIDDEYTEELLKAHEDEAERLRAEIESKAALLPKVREWHALVADEEELERSEADPNRFSRRGAAMLREEKLRRRVQVLKPRIEAELLQHLPVWEEENGRPFMVQGVRVVEHIQNAIDEKEALKEAKKRARQGLGPAPPAAAAAAARQPLGPARTVRPTPSTVMRSAAPVSSVMSVMRKREAPTPTPFAGYGAAKRQKVAVPPSIAKGSAYPVRTAAPASRIAYPSVQQTPLHQLSRVAGARVISNPTMSGYAADTPTNFFGPGGGAAAPKSRVASWSQPGSQYPPAGGALPTKQLPSVAGLAKGAARQPRKSFRPRTSIAGGMMMAARSGGMVSVGGTGMLLEEAYEIDVFDG